MAGDNHGDKTQEEPQAAQEHGHEQTAQEQLQVSSKDWEKAVAERDLRDRHGGLLVFEPELPVLLVLHVARWRKRHNVGEQQDGVHVITHRHGEYAGVYHSCIAF